MEVDGTHVKYHPRHPWHPADLMEVDGTHGLYGRLWMGERSEHRRIGGIRVGSVGKT